MTGRAEPETGDDQLDASDLLGDDGTVDRSKLASLTNGVADRDDRVQASEADEIRHALRRGGSVRGVAEAHDIAQSTVRDHAHGRVSYPNGETPTAPPVAYRDGRWQVVGDD